MATVQQNSQELIKSAAEDADEVAKSLRYQWGFDITSLPPLEITDQGRLLQRGPFGYVDGVGLYEAVNSRDCVKKYQGRPGFLKNPNDYVEQKITGLKEGKFTLHRHKNTFHQKGDKGVSCNRQFIVEYTSSFKSCDSLAFIQLIRRRYGNEVNKKVEDVNWGQATASRLTYRGFGIDRGNCAKTPLYGMSKKNGSYPSSTVGVGSKEYTPWYDDAPGMIRIKNAGLPGIDFLTFVVSFKYKDGNITAKVIDIFAFSLDLLEDNQVDIQPANVGNLLGVSDDIYGETIQELENAAAEWNLQYKDGEDVDKILLEKT